MKYECITCKLAYKFQIFKSKSSLKKRFTDRQYIKSGGQADIYQSYDELKENLVVLKVYKKKKMTEDQIIYAKQEQKIMLMLNHQIIM